MTLGRTANVELFSACRGDLDGEGDDSADPRARFLSGHGVDNSEDVTHYRAASGGALFMIILPNCSSPSPGNPPARSTCSIWGCEPLLEGAAHEPALESYLVVGGENGTHRRHESWAPLELSAQTLYSARPECSLGELRRHSGRSGRSGRSAGRRSFFLPGKNGR